MLSPQLRNEIHNLWSLFWSAGISNPLAAIEQITYRVWVTVYLIPESQFREVHGRETHQ